MSISISQSKSAIVQCDSQVRTITPMPLATTSYLVLPANPARRGLYIYNNASNTAYLTFGATSSGSTPTFTLASFGSWEMTGPVVWTGPIAAIRNAGAGAYSMVITELV